MLEISITTNEDKLPRAQELRPNGTMTVEVKEYHRRGDSPLPCRRVISCLHIGCNIIAIGQFGGPIAFSFISGNYVCRKIKKARIMAYDVKVLAHALSCGARSVTDIINSLAAAGFTAIPSDVISSVTRIQRRFSLLKTVERGLITTTN